MRLANYPTSSYFRHRLIRQLEMQAVKCKIILRNERLSDFDTDITSKLNYFLSFALEKHFKRLIFKINIEIEK